MKWSKARDLNILDFDIETRRIGFHSGGRYSPDGCEPVAIACSWAHDDKVYVWRLDHAGPVEMLRGFRQRYIQADMVTGHYIRKFDLPIINGALLEHGLPLLTMKLNCDTKGDLTDRAGLSASQENMGKMLQLEANKFHMSDYDWRAVARLEPAAMLGCVERVTSDVRQHKQLRLSLLEAGALHAPRVWHP